MPEGDTVYRVARSLDAALAGRIVTSTDFRVPAIATVDLGHRSAAPSASHGTRRRAAADRAGSRTRARR